MPDRFLLALVAAATLALPSMTEAQGRFPRAEATPLPYTAAITPYGVPASPYSLGPAPGEAGSMVLDPNRKLQPGDQLLVKIEQDKEPATALVVSQTGDVLVEPLSQGVRVAGLTVNQAQSELKRLLDKDYYFDAKVRLSLERANMQATLGSIYLSGKIGRVGELKFPAEKPMTISQAVLAAAGFQPYADDRRVQVTRVEHGSTKTFVVDVKEILSRGKVANDMLLQDGDRIYVPEVFFRK